MNVQELLGELLEAKDRSEPSCTCGIRGEDNDPNCPFMQTNEKLEAMRLEGMEKVVKEKFPDGIHLDW